MIKFSEIDTCSIWNLRDKIKKVHEYLFYNTNFDTQLKKYKEECSEFDNAETNEEKIEELADMYICACGISRFDYTLGYQLMEYVLKCKNHKEQDILIAVTKKMNILQERDWEETEDGYYKHKVHNNETEISGRKDSSKTNSKK